MTVPRNGNLTLQNAGSAMLLLGSTVSEYCLIPKALICCLLLNRG